ncbi:MAG: transcriptional regulator [Bryobacterales bacterium]|nr:transcriptional regulator [Bryobacterales bacterium]
MGSLIQTVDEKRYGRLLAKAVPRVIRNETAHESALAVIESILEKGEPNITPEESELLDLLTNLVRDYESRTYPRLPRSKPHELVAFLLEEGGGAAKDLWPIIGSKSRVSELLSGKRPISKLQAKKLAEFFHVGVDLFIE